MNNKVDAEYFRVVNDILTNGRVKKNRTGIDTIGIFGAQAKYDVNLDAFPILTTKKVHFPAILHELLWFIRGDTNIKYLVDNNVRIWNEWVYKRYTQTDLSRISENDRGGFPPHWEHKTQENFIQRIKEDVRFAKQWGELGEGTYGGMWRAFPYYDDTQLDPQVGYVDQLQKVIDKLKTNPDDRRMIVSAWHPHWVDHCALPPCHCLYHFNTEELTLEERWNIIEKYNQNTDGKPTDLFKQSDMIDNPDGFNVACDNIGVPRRRLNCLLYQRSNDFFLGVPFNITSYALLTAMVAHITNMVPGTFTHSHGDAHVYTNHIEQFKTQMAREPKALPRLWINPEVKDLFSFKYEDIRLENYDPHPAIKGQVAV